MKRFIYNSGRKVFVYNGEFKEEDHPRGEDGKFGGGGGSKGKKDEQQTKDKNEIKPQEQLPKPQVKEKMGNRFMSSMLQDIDGFGPIDNDDEYKKQAMKDIRRQLKSKGIEYIDAYHVTDMKTKNEGIEGSSIDATGGYSGRIREKSVYMFFDPSDIKKGYDGITGAQNEENTIMHIKIPLNKLEDLRWDGLYNLTFDTYSAVRVLGDVPPEWIDGMYKYKHPNQNSRPRRFIYKANP